MPKIELPIWVYEVFFKYRNVALPNICMQMDKKALIRHLEKRLGCKIRLRTAVVRSSDTRYLQKVVIENKYLIAEEK